MESNDSAKEESSFFYKLLRKKISYESDSEHAELEKEFFENEAAINKEEGK